MLFEDGDAMARHLERPCSRKARDAPADDDKVESVLRSWRYARKCDMHEERENVRALSWSRRRCSFSSLLSVL